jgi:hypothetical protein
VLKSLVVFRFTLRPLRGYVGSRLTTSDPSSFFIGILLRVVTFWQANNPNARNFRLMSIGKAYKSRPLKEGGGVYMAKIEKPEHGWTASFV